MEKQDNRKSVLVWAVSSILVAAVVVSLGLMGGTEVMASLIGKILGTAMGIGIIYALLYFVLNRKVALTDPKRKENKSKAFAGAVVIYGVLYFLFSL